MELKAGNILTIVFAAGLILGVPQWSLSESNGVRVDRPYVQDEIGGLDSAESAKLESELKRLDESGGMAIRLFLLRDSPGQSAEDLAWGALQSMSGKPLAAVLVHAPGGKQHFTTALGGFELRNLSREDLETAQEVIRVQAAGGRDFSDSLKKALAATSSELTNLKLLAGEKSAAPATAGMDSKSIKVFALIGGTGVLLLTGVSLARARQKKPGAGQCLFPEVEFRRRFQGNYSGGNDIALQFKSKSSAIQV